MRRLEEYAGKINDLMNLVRDSEHPAAEDIYESIGVNGYGHICDFTSIAEPFLEYPDRIRRR